MSGIADLFDPPDAPRAAPEPPPPKPIVPPDPAELARLRRELNRRRTSRDQLVIDPATNTTDGASPLRITG